MNNETIFETIIPNKFFCNLCGGLIVRIKKGAFGLRCVLCRSTFIHRAITQVFQAENVDSNSTIYELSMHGAFYKFLKRRYERLTTSDFIDTVPFGTMYNGKLIQNIEKVTFFSESFDVVTSTEVFEHVAHDIDGFKEVHRILKREGKFIFTVPLNLNEKKTVIRAKLKADGKIEHILEPEYHGDYLRKGILTFRNYGIDIADFLEEAGFASVKIYNVKTQFSIEKAVVCAKK